MRIRKFNCPTCGAAKVSPYKTPFVTCDYCGGWIDLDASLWLQIYTEKKKMKLLEELEERTLIKTRKAINDKNRELYFRAQQEYFATFYNIYPEFIPPTIGKGEKFKAFLKTKAEWNTDLKFDDALGLKKKRAAADRAMQNLQSPKEPHVDFFGAFVDTAAAYHKYLQLEAEEKNTNPKFGILKEIYPQEFEYKMRMSLFVNAYLFRLSDLELKHFKNRYGLEYEFVEITEPSFTNIHCNNCQQIFKAPQGAIRCVCEHCLELSIIQRNIHCANCGVENQLPEKWNPLINCTSCGTEIRVVNLGG